LYTLVYFLLVYWVLSICLHSACSVFIAVCLFCVLTAAYFITTCLPAAVHQNAAIFRTRPSFWAYLVPIKISWQHLKWFKSYCVDKHTPTSWHYWNPSSLHYHCMGGENVRQHTDLLRQSSVKQSKLAWQMYCRIRTSFVVFAQYIARYKYDQYLTNFTE